LIHQLIVIPGKTVIDGPGALQRISLQDNVPANAAAPVFPQDSEQIEREETSPLRRKSPISSITKRVINKK
jgi:hypothetical protein